ncbi:MAG: phosphoribosylglycinamide formyltransferase [Deltaproteobacteria bacterium]|nr:MAG: phosphoribosylglycinamide formyltransferase [Deltaproteobacteria bacterium]TMQ12349.1 MAG: phosphoribosylglycinamide formyltransferase [Deltaproteobacteria bacterium]
MKFGVLVSGTGTNLQALLDARARGELAPAEIAVVISNVRDAPALARATTAGVPAEVVEHRGFERAEFERRLGDALARHGVEAVVLAGFMRVLTAAFVARHPLRIINTHPSLLPAFPGLDAAAQALAHGVKLTGATIHFVDASLDGGPIIAQAAVPVMDDDDARTLHARIQREEHRLLPIIVRRLAAGQLSCQGRLVRGCAE